MHSNPQAARLLPGDLRPIYEKVLAGERIGDDEALLLFRHRDLNALGTIANVLRERKNGNYGFYNINSIER